MRVLAWNIAHQTRQRPIPSDLPALFEAVGADVILLNEYVEQRPRPEFRDGLREHGYVHQEVSFSPGVHNQVLAAARVPFTKGDLCPPTLGERMDGSAISNFLHIRLDNDLEMVGVRAPAYKRPHDVLAYWAELAVIMESVADRPILFAGDINTNPFKKAGIPDATSMPFWLCSKFVIPNPAGEWSFFNQAGRGTPTRIDHVIHSMAASVTDAQYVAQHGGQFLAGRKVDGPISDHAALVFDASPA